MVDQAGSMTHFEKKIFTWAVVVEEIPGDPRSLSHPVEPDAQLCAIYVVLTDEAIHGSMEFDAGHFCAAEEAADMDVMNLISSNLAEGWPQTSHDPGLFAMGDMVIPDHVMADIIGRPTIF